MDGPWPRPACAGAARTSSWPTRSRSSSPSSSTSGTRCPTSRCGTPTSWAGGRSWRTRSRPSSRRSPGRLRAAVLEVARRRSAVLKLLVAAFGTYLLGRALGMRFGGALLAGRRVRVRDVLRRLAGVAADEHLPAAAVAAACSTELVIGGRGPLAGAGLAAAGRAHVPGRAPRDDLPRPASPPSPSSRSGWCSSGRARAAGASSLTRPAVAFGARGGRRRRARGGRRCCRCSSCSLPLGRLRGRLDLAPGHAREYLGALFLFDYWGRPDPDVAGADSSATAASTPAASR